MFKDLGLYVALYEKGTSSKSTKEGSAFPQSLDYQSGEYRNRTDDLLTASQTL